MNPRDPITQHGVKDMLPGVAALSGIKVIDLGRVLAAPFATQILADLGADVIKIERPGVGDEARVYGPHFVRHADGSPSAESGFYVACNRNKRSMTIDLSTKQGQLIVKALAAKADVLVENFLPGALGRFGLDYASLAAVNPALIYCSLTGYGQTGPYKDRPGYDAVFQAFSGLMAVTGHPDEVPGGGPMKIGPSLIDASAGHYAATAVMAALLERERLSGLGQHIDISLLDAAVAVQTHAVQNYLLSGEQPGRFGNAGNGGHPARTFDCVDGQIYISAGNGKFYKRLCRVIGREDLVHDERFLTNALRFENRKAWDAIVTPIISRWRAKPLLDALIAEGIPASLVNTYDDLFADEHVIFRELKQTLPYPQAESGQISMVASPLRLSRTPPRIERAPPQQGVHTAEILRDWLGMEGDEIEAFLTSPNQVVD